MKKNKQTEEIFPSQGNGRFTDKITFKLLEEHKEKNSGEIITIPDEAYSVKQLLLMSEAGTVSRDKIIRSVVFGNPEDHEDLDLEAVDRMDLNERDEIAEQVIEKINYYRAVIEQKRKEQEEASKVVPPDDPGQK